MPSTFLVNSLNMFLKKNGFTFSGKAIYCNNQIPIITYNIPIAAHINKANMAPALNAIVFMANALVFIFV